MNALLLLNLGSVIYGGVGIFFPKLLTTVGIRLTALQLPETSS